MPAEPRVVLDTNLLVSAALLSRSLPRRVLDHVRLNGQLLLSLETFVEHEGVLLLSKFDRYTSREKRKELLELLPSVAEWISTSSTITACRDPKDDKFLELAVDGKADFLVTGDKDLLELVKKPDPAWTFQIVTPEAYLEAVGKN